MASAGKRRLGEILCENGSITQSQLKEALEEKKSRKNWPLGQILIELNYITDEQLSNAYLQCGRTASWWWIVGVGFASPACPVGMRQENSPWYRRIRKSCRWVFVHHPPPKPVGGLYGWLLLYFNRRYLIPKAQGHKLTRILLCEVASLRSTSWRRFV